MKLLIIRHGESEADILKVHEGRADFSLTEKGRKQAQKMSEWVSSNYQVDKLYCSPMSRTRQTADFFKEKMGLEPHFEDDLMEFNNGLLKGLPFDVALVKYPPVQNLPIDQSVYEMESLKEFRTRAEGILNRIISENDSGSTVAVITHGGMIVQLYHCFLGLPIGFHPVFTTGDTGIHCWRIEGEKRRIEFSNRVTHLEK
jgi:2,3-bisphosphoglycerate-dependent phosphoglycerate mutase